jgi:hypothetical protein
MEYSPPRREGAKILNLGRYHRGERSHQMDESLAGLKLVPTISSSRLGALAVKLPFASLGLAGVFDPRTGLTEPGYIAAGLPSAQAFETLVTPREAFVYEVTRRRGRWGL